MAYLSQEFLDIIQAVLPAFLFILLLSAFIEWNNRTTSLSSDEFNGIVPVIVPVSRVRSRLTSILLVLLALTFVLSLSLLLVYDHGELPALAIWFSVSNFVVWGTAASLVWIRRNRTASEFVWAKAVGWVGLLGTVLIGSERISQFVQDTKDPQTEFPLPFFLFLIIYSIRLLLLILILWALHNPIQEYVPAARRSTSNLSAHISHEENAPLLSQTRDRNGVEEQGVQEEGASYGTFTDMPDSETTLDAKRNELTKPLDKDLAGGNTESDQSHSDKRPAPSIVKNDEQAQLESLTTSKTTDNTAGPPSQPFSYAEAVTHPVSSVAHATEENKTTVGSSDIIQTTENRGECKSSSSTTSTPSVPKNISTEPDMAVPFSESNELAYRPESTSPHHSTTVPMAGPSTKSDIVFPTSTSPVSSFDIPARQLEDSPRPSTDSTEFSLNGGSKEKSKKKGTTLADVGRRVSNESNKFVRRISLINKTKSGSNPGGSPSTSPSRSPLSLPQELNPIETSELDVAQSEVAGNENLSGSPIAKRFALINRKPSSASSTSRIPLGLQEDTTKSLIPPALEEAAGQAPSPNGSISGSGSGSGSKKKKKKKNKNGKNAKGKKATKNKN